MIGDGPDRARLKAMAGPTVVFLGEKAGFRGRGSFFPLPSIASSQVKKISDLPLEANASGRPVIAYGVGGPVDTVIDGNTGINF